MNMVGEETNSCVFQIVQLPPIIKADIPKMQERKEGAEFVLTASFDGSPPPTAVWLHDGEPIVADEERISITEEGSEDGMAMVKTLRITEVVDEDNGKYTLLVKNTAGEEKVDTLLDVQAKPKVVKPIEPQEITIPGRTKLHLQCKFSGFPAPNIKWYRDGNEIKVREGVLQFQDAAGGANLVLEKSDKSDAGVYLAKGILIISKLSNFSLTTRSWFNND